MKKIEMNDLDRIMRRWVKTYRAFGLFRDEMFSEEFMNVEKAFLFSAFAEILDTDVEKITNDQVPPIVLMCFQSGRPITSLGNWDEDAPDQRLADASLTWSDRVSMFPRGGDEQWA